MIHDILKGYNINIQEKEPKDIIAYNYNHDTKTIHIYNTTDEETIRRITHTIRNNIQYYKQWKIKEDKELKQ